MGERLALVELLEGGALVFGCSLLPIHGHALPWLRSHQTNQIRCKVSLIKKEEENDRDAKVSIFQRLLTVPCFYMDAATAALCVYAFSSRFFFLFLKPSGKTTNTLTISKSCSQRLRRRVWTK